MTSLDELHICFVAPDTWPVLADDRTIESAGGAQVQQALLARALASRGIRVSMVCFDYGQPDRVSVGGVTVFKCHRPDDGVPLVRFLHPRLTGIWSALRRADADIYYQRSAGSLTGVSAMFAKMYGRRFVYAVAHDLDLARNQTAKLFQRRAGWRDQRLFQLGLTLADDVVVQHPGQLRDCERWYQRVPTLVPSCYVQQRTQQATLNGTVLWVSTLRRWKRPELFLDLARRLPHLRFRMVGGPAVGEHDLFDRIKKAATALTNVEFIGFVPFAEIDAHFNDVSVFVNTSDYEGFPNTFLQSWSRGIPTVSFVNTGSTTIDGEQVVTVARSLDEMVKLVGRLTQDADYWVRSGRRARNCYETFHTPEAAMAVYLRVFEKQWNALNETRSLGGRQRPVVRPVKTTQ